MARLRSICTWLCLPLLLLGCARSPKSQINKLPILIPERFSTDNEMVASEPFDWISDFGDPTLQELVAEVQRSNYDLESAAGRLEAVAANQRIVRAARVPAIQGGFSGSRQKNNFQNLAGSIGARLFNSYNLNASVAWEADLWGKVKNRTQAAIADVEAEQANFLAFQFSLAANTLRT